MFTSEEIDANKSDLKKWHAFVRRREAEIIFSMFPGKRFELALELGAGNGGQSVTISQFCARLICTGKDDKSQSWLGQTILERQIENVESSFVMPKICPNSITPCSIWFFPATCLSMFLTLEGV
jgi:hypothetical protein